jgi:DNA-binding transcriptional regulator PaaX
MGILEQEHRRKRKRANLQKAVLMTIAASGVLPVALLAPNIIGAAKKIGLLPTARTKGSIVRTRDRLIARGFLQYEGNKLRITKNGEQHLRLLRLDEYASIKPKRWDNKWRVLIFDIPEYRKSIREKVRRTLTATGFVRLQDSVWIFPYDCEDLIVLLKADFKVGKDMLYMIVDSLEYDIHLRKRFDLR